MTRPLTVAPGVCVPSREPATNATKVCVFKTTGFNNKYCGWCVPHCQSVIEDRVVNCNTLIYCRDFSYKKL